jgi:hypothetical protein
MTDISFRPKSAQSDYADNNETVKLVYNAQEDKNYLLKKDGREMESNRRGDHPAKFIPYFSGFYNFKHRLEKAKNNEALMYVKPNLKYKKHFRHPISTKFKGYAQYPYDIAKTLPEHLETE